jgi:hypothetical protein
LRYKKQITAQLRQQLIVGAPTNQDKAGLRQLSRQIKTKKVIVKLFVCKTLSLKYFISLIF